MHKSKPLEKDEAFKRFNALAFHSLFLFDFLSLSCKKIVVLLGQKDICLEE